MFFMRIVGILLGFSLSFIAVGAEVDFALVKGQEAWLRHPVVGEASYDSFERFPGNPICRGRAPYAWPVNGFFFSDPKSGHWYVYVGEYTEGYQISAESPSRCIIYRSEDAGKRWERVGPIFSGPPHLFEGEQVPMTRAPDVSVLYAEGRYHMVFDWGTSTLTWQNAHNPPADANGGVGYAWAEQPEGPFHIAARPVATTRDQPLLLGKYKRVYASTLIRREKDWLVLSLTDSGSYFGWALLGMTAAQPEGPYTTAKPLLYPELDRYHPALLEFFPQFVHAGKIYAPATSVALNRNFQCLFSVDVEQAMDSSAWTLEQVGSMWHGEAVEAEAYGIWGQTFTGFVDPAGVLQVMFPSRDKAGMGTINLARRPWATMQRERGFVVSGHAGASLAILRRNGPFQSIDALVKASGDYALWWNYQAPVSPNRASSNSTVHVMSTTRHSGLWVTSDSWALYSRDALGKDTIHGQGVLPIAQERHLEIRWDAQGKAVLSVDEEALWEVPLAMGAGAFALHASPYSVVEVTRLRLSGDLAVAPVAYWYVDALLGGAQRMADWEEVESEQFRYGKGAFSKTGASLAKWNFQGKSVQLWAPRAPGYGKAKVFLDGQAKGEIDFSAASSEPSSPLFEAQDLEGEYHALVLRSFTGKTPLDCIIVK